MDFDGKNSGYTSKTDGQPRRKLDVSKAEENFGFEAQTEFREELKKNIM